MRPNQRKAPDSGGSKQADAALDKSKKVLKPNKDLPKPKSGGKPKKIDTEKSHVASRHRGTGKVEASKQDNVKHKTFKNKSGNTENETG